MTCACKTKHLQLNQSLNHAGNRSRKLDRPFITTKQAMLLLVLTWCFVPTIISASPGSNDDDRNRKPTPYPKAFRVSFQTNISAVSNSVDIGQNGANKHDYPLSGTLYYDWSLESQRIDHAAGSYECVHFYQTDLACTLYFNPRGMYRVLHHGPDGDGDDEDDNDNDNDNERDQKQHQRRCCLDIPGLGAPSPDWASRANPTFNGVVLDQYSGLETYQWTFDNLEPPIHFWRPSERVKVGVYGDVMGEEEMPVAFPFREKIAGYHVVREVASAASAEGRSLSAVGAPVLFSFPGKDTNGKQDYHYDVGSLVAGPQDPSLFKLPIEGCANVDCFNSLEGTIGRSGRS